MSAPKQLKGRPRAFDRDEAAWVIGLLNEGMRMDYIAHHVYGISRRALLYRLCTWGYKPKSSGKVTQP